MLQDPEQGLLSQSGGVTSLLRGSDGSLRSQGWKESPGVQKEVEGIESSFIRGKRRLKR